MVWEITINSTKIGSVKKIVQELNGHEDAIITLANTSDNRTLVGSDRDVTVKWDGTTIFFGRLKGADFFEETLDAIVYDKVYEKMAGKDFTGEYLTTSADTVLSAICTAAGVTKGTCPSTLVSVKFVKANCLDAALFLASACNKDFWSSAGTTFNIGDRGQTLGTFVPLARPKRGVDRSTQYNHVWVRGVDSSSSVIWGEAKSAGWTPETDRPRTFQEKKATDSSTLNNIAASKLKLLEKESSGVTVPLKIADGMTITIGDTITINQPELNLSGAYRVWKTTKKVDSVEVEIDVPEALAGQYILAQTSLEDLGIYPEPFLAPGSAPQDNMILNGSFEQDSDGDGHPDFWTPEQLGNPASSKGRSSDDAKEGKYSVKIVGVGSPNYTWSGYYQDIPIEGGRTYILRVQSRAALAQPCLEIWHPILDANKAELSNVGLVERGTPGTVWTEYVSKIVIAANYAGTKPAYIRIRLAYKQDAGTATTLFFDSVWFMKQISWEEMFSEEQAVLTNARRFEGESDSITRTSGTVITDDSTASKGKMIVRPYSQPSGTMWYGPYRRVGAGEYYALFALRISDIQGGQGDNNVINVVVNSNIYGGSLASRSLTPNMIGATWKVFALRFRAQENWTDVELCGYNFVTGRASVYMDWVGWVPANTPLADVTVLTSSTGVDDLTTALDMNDSPVGPDCLGASFGDFNTFWDIHEDVTLAAGSFSDIIFNHQCGAMSGAFGLARIEVTLTYVSGSTSDLKIRFYADSHSIPTTIRAEHFNKIGSGGLATVKMIILVALNLNNWYLYLNAYSSAEVVIDADMKVFQYLQHQHTITEISSPAYRGQTGINPVSHKHTITEPPQPRGVDKTGGTGTQPHYH